MPRFDNPVPPGFAETDAGRIQAFLVGRGYAVEGVAPAVDQNGTPVAVTVWADRDPAGEFAAYQSTPTPQEAQQAAAIQTIRQAVAAIRAKDPAQRTAQERFNEAVAVVLRALSNGS